jgi:pimeloyl-ACP methyl ester carboxylesterase
VTEAQRGDTGFAEVSGVPLYYDIAGAGHPLVLIHEGIADSRMYDDQFSAFAQHYRVIRYDVHGFGKSGIPAGPFSGREALHDLLRVLGVERTYLLGMSMGGGIAIDFTLTYPTMVDALITLKGS